MTKVFPAKIYDKLKEAADRFGGIGGGEYAHDGNGKHVFGFDPDAVPYCVFGYAQYLDGKGGVELDRTLRYADIGPTENDRAVWKEFPEMKFEDKLPRIPFDIWAKNLDVVREEDND